MAVYADLTLERNYYCRKREKLESLIINPNTKTGILSFELIPHTLQCDGISYLILEHKNNTKERKTGESGWVLIPARPACKADSLPSKLIPHTSKCAWWYEQVCFWNTSIAIKPTESGYQSQYFLHAKLVFHYLS